MQNFHGRTVLQPVSWEGEPLKVEKLVSSWTRSSDPEVYDVVIKPLSLSFCVVTHLGNEPCPISFSRHSVKDTPEQRYGCRDHVKSQMGQGF